MGKSKGKVRKKIPSRLYTRGELNKILDGVVHPFFKKGNGFIFMDGFLHALLEQNAPVSARKFIRYNLPKMLERMGKKHGSERKHTKKAK
jgi:hypothetical protein